MNAKTRAQILNHQGKVSVLAKSANLQPQDEPRVRLHQKAIAVEMDLEAEINRQRQLGYETYTDWLNRTGFTDDEDSYKAWIGEGKWLITSQPKRYGS